MQAHILYTGDEVGEGHTYIGTYRQVGEGHTNEDEGHTDMIKRLTMCYYICSIQCYTISTMSKFKVRSPIQELI